MNLGEVLRDCCNCVDIFATVPGSLPTERREPMTRTRTRLLLAVCLALGLLFASTGLRDSGATETAPQAVEAVESDLGALESLSRIEPLTQMTMLVTTTTVPPTTAPPTTARPRPTPTTTAPVVEAAAAPEPEPESVPLESGSGNGDPNDYASWDRLAQCESGGDWSINTGNGYYGGLQFSLNSWRGVGGTGYPHEHSRATQIQMGQRLHAQGGWRHWPGCTRSFGWT